MEKKNFDNILLRKDFVYRDMKEFDEFVMESCYGRLEGHMNGIYHYLPGWLQNEFNYGNVKFLSFYTGADELIKEIFDTIVDRNISVILGDFSPMKSKDLDKYFSILFLNTTVLYKWDIKDLLDYAAEYERYEYDFKPPTKLFVSTIMPIDIMSTRGLINSFSEDFKDKHNIEVEYIDPTSKDESMNSHKKYALDMIGKV